MSLQHLFAPTPITLVHFEDRGDQRETALLGMIAVGELGPCRATQFYWRLWLPDWVFFGHAPTAKAAREHLTSRIEQWIEAADLKSAKS